MNDQVELTWQTLKTMAHSTMIHARVSGEYIHCTLMYTTDHIFPVMQIKNLVNHDVEPNLWSC